MKIFNPAVRILNRQSYPRKFAVVAIVAAIPLVWVSYKAFSRLGDDITTADAEAQGLDCLVPLKSLLRSVQIHRGLASRQLRGESVQRELLEAEHALDESLTAFNNLRHAGEFDQQWASVQRDYELVHGNAATADAAECMQRHSALCGEILELIAAYGNSSGLILDPEAGTYHLACSLIYPLPELSECLAQLRYTGMNTLKTGELTADERARLYTLVALARDKWKSLGDNIAAAISASPEMQGMLEPDQKSAGERFDNLLGLIETKLLAGQAAAVTPDQYWQASTTAINALFKFYDSVVPGFTQLLKDRIAKARHEQETIAAFGTLAFLLSTYIFIGLYLSISRSIVQVKDATQQIVQGTLAGEFKLDCTDELSAIGTAFNQINTVFREARALKNSIEAEKQKLQASVDELLVVVRAASEGDLTQTVAIGGNDAIGQLGERIGVLIRVLHRNISSISQNADLLAEAAEEMSATSHQLASSVEESNRQAGEASAASEQVSRNVQTVATATEQMSASIREIAKNAADSARVAGNAVQIAAATNESIAKLGNSSTEIGQVIKVITTIAQQTNLLALNATIEAARAGEAGKGFAVVANEVKELAKETARATEDISGKIETIQADTARAVKAIDEVSRIIGQIDSISSTIASAVEEQSVTTAEIGRNVAEGARGADEIARNISGVAKFTAETSAGASNTQSAAGRLAGMAAELKQVVSTFKLANDASAIAPAQRRDRAAQAEPKAPQRALNGRPVPVSC